MSLYSVNANTIINNINKKQIASIIKAVTTTAIRLSKNKTANNLSKNFFISNKKVGSKTTLQLVSIA